MAENKVETRLYVVCGSKQVKEVKNWLEGQNALFKGEKIKSAVYEYAAPEENAGRIAFILQFSNPVALKDRILPLLHNPKHLGGQAR